MKKLWKWMVMVAIPHCDYSVAVNCNLKKVCCSVAQLCSTLCNPMDCSTPGFPVLQGQHGNPKKDEHGKYYLPHAHYFTTVKNDIEWYTHFLSMAVVLVLNYTGIM